MILDSVDLELTGRCQLQCLHCYASSGPEGNHGTMDTASWSGVIDQAAALGARRVQFIGGEATTYPGFEPLLRQAVSTGLAVEVFSNLLHVREAWWELFALPGVKLATSYYSDQADEHDAVTARGGSHTRTRANIIEAVRRGIPIRAAIVEVVDGQRVERAREELHALGVRTVGVDWVRGVGRGATAPPQVSQLCGRCGQGKAAVGPNGDVWPCVIARWMRAGNVQRTPLAEIIAGNRWRTLVSTVPAPRHRKVCNPDCKPSQSDGSDCAPAETEACDPSYCEPDG
ncbi:radical SAM/SPASM domain-containing protein [Nonomuraea glycinis]|uniref:radical SAM/SPASM domain-containing protein n=1 Tax=Nonomuraea glycinis TaxID=2047744 RepID=UPI002E0D5E27|nr:radical SAM/SPASM domain-containing protein [Nonomuraea glycinis]